MARRRWIDPSFWEDEEIGDLSFPQRIFFVGCWSNADDEGRLRGNPAFLRGEIFRYDDLSLEEVVEIRDAVLKVMPRSLAIYEANDREYLAFDEAHWKRYQNPNHPKASTLPTPPSDLFADTEREEERPIEERQNPEGQPQDDGKNPTDMDRVGLDRVGKGSGRSDDSEPFSQIFTEVTGVLIATAVQAEEIDAWMEDISEDWFRDACKEAVDNNARKWSYIRAILKRWKKEGKKTQYAKDKRRGKRTGPTPTIDYDQALKRQAEAELDA